MDEKLGISIEYQTPEQVYKRGKQLEGMTFRDVLDLDIVPKGVNREYNSRRYKGGMGTLIEERFFGYKANSDREADFAKAGVELKATCIDRRKNGNDAAGERLVLTMIPYDEEAPVCLYDSYLWHKCQRMLLVWYRRDRTIDPYDQRIEHVLLFTPPDEDLRVFESDYALITGMVRAGRADELSESLTTYLGACTKGATRAKSMRDQSFSRWWRKFAKESGFAGLRFHELRHTQASQLVASGMDIKTVQHRLGHASASLTLNQYSHALPAKDAEAAQFIGNLFAPVPKAGVHANARKSA